MLFVVGAWTEKTKTKTKTKRQIHPDEEMLFVVGLGLIQGGNESDSRQERGGAAKYGLPTLCFVYLTTHPQYGTILRKVFDLNITQVKNRRGFPHQA